MIKKAISRVGIFLMSLCCLAACNLPTNNQSSSNDNSSSSVNQNSSSSTNVPVRKPNIITKTPGGIPDFTVEVEEGRDPVVLQLTDTQIIDAGQARPGRVHDPAFWATDQIEERCYDWVTEIIEATNPDLIILTGDIVYGEFDDSGTALVSFVEFMESFEIAWAPVFGNHDNESAKGVDWQCEQFENAEYCLFDQKTLTGNGNYSVGIKQGGELKRVFYMLDSNGCGAPSAATTANGHSSSAVGFAQDQINWYTNQINELKEESPDTKISFAYHIQQAIFGSAFEKYQFSTQKDVYIDYLTTKADGDFGYFGRSLKNPWDSTNTVWNGMKALGVDSVFVGHEHCNSASVVYDGVRFQFGQKSSEYDRFNYVKADGKIEGGYSKNGTSLIGGSVIPLSEEDGSIVDPYIYICQNADEEIDKDYYKDRATVMEVNGLQCDGTDLYTGINVTAAKANFNNIVAYHITVNEQGKMYVNLDLLKNKTKFTFTLYTPSTSTSVLSGLGELAIRVKPNSISPGGAGYIVFNSASADPTYRLKFDTWQTFTIDISSFGTSCEEFAFTIPKGNEFYIRDISIS